jgi:hypothetical protein
MSGARKLSWRSAGKGALLLASLVILHIHGGFLTLSLGTALMLITLWVWWK